MQLQVLITLLLAAAVSAQNRRVAKGETAVVANADSYNYDPYYG